MKLSQGFILKTKTFKSKPSWAISMKIVSLDLKQNLKIVSEIEKLNKLIWVYTCIKASSL